MENKLYSDIESTIIGWTIDGTKTAGSLTRDIMDIIKNQSRTFNEEEMEFIKRCIESHWEIWNQTHEDNQKDWVISQNILNRQDNGTSN
jgi:hypothetical protein